jgi:hypothetical protein
MDRLTFFTIIDSFYEANEYFVLDIAYDATTDILFAFKNGVFVSEDAQDPDAFTITDVSGELRVSKKNTNVYPLYRTGDKFSFFVVKDGTNWTRITKTIITPRTKTASISVNIHSTDMIFLFQNGIYMEEQIDYTRNDFTFTNTRGTWSLGTVLSLVVIRPTNVVYKIGFNYGIQETASILILPSFVNLSIDTVLMFRNGLYVSEGPEDGQYTIGSENGIYNLSLNGSTSVWWSSDLLNVVILSYTALVVSTPSMSEASYIEVIKTGKFRPVVRISKLREIDESIYETITAFVISGTYTESNGNGKRRSCNLVLENSTGQFIVSHDEFPLNRPDSMKFYNFWLNTKIKLEIGIKNGNDEIFFNKGIYYITNPEIASQLSERTINLKLEDKWAKLDGTVGGTLSSSYEIPVTTSIFDAVKEILHPTDPDELVLDYKQPIIQAIPSFYPYEDTLPYTIRKNEGGTYAEMLTEIAGINSYDIYYDEDGNLVMGQARSDIVQGSSWDFSTEEVSYMGGTRMFKFEDVFNRVVVVGDNVNGDIARFVATNDDVASPTRISIIGEKAKLVEDSNIPNDALAEIRANYELEKCKRLYDGISLTCLPLLHLSCNDVVSIKDNALFTEGDDIVGNYIIQSISYDVNCLNQASFSIWKANDVLLYSTLLAPLGVEDTEDVPTPPEVVVPPEPAEPVALAIPASASQTYRTWNNAWRVSGGVADDSVVQGGAAGASAQYGWNFGCMWFTRPADWDSANTDREVVSATLKLYRNLPWGQPAAGVSFVKFKAINSGHTAIKPISSSGVPSPTYVQSGYANAGPFGSWNYTEGYVQTVNVPLDLVKEIFDDNYAIALWRGQSGYCGFFGATDSNYSGHDYRPLLEITYRAGTPPV